MTMELVTRVEAAGLLEVSPKYAGELLTGAGIDSALIQGPTGAYRWVYPRSSVVDFATDFLAARTARASKCKNGLHEMVGDNVKTVRRKDGYIFRVCRSCWLARSARTRARNLEAFREKDRAYHGKKREARNADRRARYYAVDPEVRAAKSRTYRAANLELIQLYDQQRAGTIERKVSKFAARLEYQYHLSIESWHRLIVFQLGCCGICAIPLAGEVKASIDHDHACCDGSGKSCGRCILGILCNACNIGLNTGRGVQADLERSRLRQAYLSNPPAEAVGIYCPPYREAVAS